MDGDNGKDNDKQEDPFNTYILNWWKEESKQRKWIVNGKSSCAQRLFGIKRTNSLHILAIVRKLRLKKSEISLHKWVYHHASTSSEWLKLKWEKNQKFKIFVEYILKTTRESFQEKNIRAYIYRDMPNLKNKKMSIEMVLIAVRSVCVYVLDARGFDCISHLDIMSYCVF